MIEASCSACGTLNRVSEANVPVGAKFITCADCKSRIAIPGVAAAPPPPPKLPPANPAAARSGGAGDLSDLPAPKRTSALGPPPRPRPAPPKAEPSRPAPRGGLAAALDPELPAPKATRSAGPPSAPTLELDDPPATAAFDGGVDLPAPKRAVPRAPAPEGPRDVIIDLPAPKIDRSVADLPAPKLNPRRAPAAMPPLKEPPRPPVSADLPEPREPRPPASADLPMPRGPTSADLPMPRGPTIADLPAPRAQDAQARSDLLAPKGFFDDPAEPAPQPADLPAPKGFFDDLPQPALRKPADLPAPKGFFDDVAQPRPVAPAAGTTDLPAPKGFFDDLPQVKAHPAGDVPEVPAPMGYFEDIPGLPSASKPEVPAPKGYFENIPGLPSTSKPEVPAPKGFFDDIPGLPHVAKPEAPAPKGHFDNIPGRPVKKSDDVAPKGFFDDLPQRARTAPPARADGADPGLELDAGPELDLAPPRAASSFDDVDLSRPSAPPVRFDPVSRPAPTRPALTGPRGGDAGPVLELEDAPALAAPRAAPQRPANARSATEARTTPEIRARRRRLLILAGLAVILLGGAGFVLYRRHVAAREREAAISEQLVLARKAYAASEPKHWQRAAAAARRVVDLDDANAEALGIGAEALLASALDDGTNSGPKIAQAHAMLDTANSHGITRPELARARALAALAARQPDAAITALTALRPPADAAHPDPALALYLGWALAAKGDAAAAVTAFDRAAGIDAVKVSALYGRGGAKLALGDLDGARADFTAVLELASDHIGAQVGLAAAQPSSAARRREADLLAILARKDIAAADPRAVALAWTLAGDSAMRAGRYDVARERFRKALDKHPQDLAATAGLAETELRDGKIAAAAELTARALGAAKDDVAAQLVQSEIEIKQRRLTLATQRLTALANRATPLSPLETARLQLVTGKLREAEGKDDAAVDAYVAGAAAARELDLEPLLAAVGKLAAMTTAAVAERDAPRATALRARADELLGGFTEQARRDPQLALTLGIGYLQSGNPDKAEPWLRRAAQARPDDAEARFQLGRALLRSGKPQDALEVLDAALRLDAARADIAADLAHTYELLGRDGDAGALYTRLLAGAEPSLEIRARGGRFFARIGARDKAAEQGKKILAVDPRHPAGLYLKGEGLLAADKPLEAKQQFQRAIEADRDPQYLDALGRAAEALAQGGDREAQELALRSYQSAAEAAPGMLNPLVGQGRLYVARHEAAKAVLPLLAASRLDGKNADVMFLIGAAYQEIQQPAMARQWLEDAARLAPSAEAYWRIAQIDRDANRGPQAVAALSSATRLASETEKRTGKPVAWLTDALYLEGRVSLDLHNEAAAREAWVRYVARNPPASVQLGEVKQLLATQLRR
ncbi:MAG TPA: tetratricopeptide repeat protein [Kofleriaceae bacterium]